MVHKTPGSEDQIKYIMTVEVIAAIIGAVGTSVGAIGAVGVSGFLENKNAYAIDSPRIGALKGTWDGTVTQLAPGGAESKFTVQLKLTPSTRKISGTGTIFYKPAGEGTGLGHGGGLRVISEKGNATEFVVELNQPFSP